MVKLSSPLPNRTLVSAPAAPSDTALLLVAALLSIEPYSAPSTLIARDPPPVATISPLVIDPASRLMLAAPSTRTAIFVPLPALSVPPLVKSSPALALIAKPNTLLPPVIVPPAWLSTVNRLSNATTPAFSAALIEPLLVRFKAPNALIPSRLAPAVPLLMIEPLLVTVPPALRNRPLLPPLIVPLLLSVSVPPAFTPAPLVATIMPALVTLAVPPVRMPSL